MYICTYMCIYTIYLHVIVLRYNIVIVLWWFTVIKQSTCDIRFVSFYFFDYYYNFFLSYLYLLNGTNNNLELPKQLVPKF